MAIDEERIARIKDAMHAASLDAILCLAPEDVLLVSGYWPVVGTALAVATREGEVRLVAPEDERQLAQHGWADRIETFSPGSLTALIPTHEAAMGALQRVTQDLCLARIGFAAGEFTEPSSYAGVHRYGSDGPAMLAHVCPTASVAPTDLLARLRSVKTSRELARIRIACRIATEAFARMTADLKSGLKETEAAALLQTPLSTAGVGVDETIRAGGYAFCMSGPNSARAYAAYQISSSRPIKSDEFILMHCNSYADGFWTDITRTYCLERADERKHRIYQAILMARRAALDAVAPGVRAAEVDQAARRVLADHGFGAAFKHPTGHGVGFAAIDHNALPRIHPKSTEILETGMVFNIEPGVYFEDYGGCRHCDMVAVDASGAELLTSTAEEWLLR
jgi:Xaa-Pro aminopeptidase